MSSSELVEQRKNRYRAEIYRLTPPKSTHDEFLLQVYKDLLASVLKLQRYNNGTKPPVTGG